MTTLLVVFGFMLAYSGPASASVTVLCSGNSYATCINAGYTAHGFEQHYQASYWGAYSGHNCTNYAAYMMSLNGAAAPGYSLGNGADWASRAASHGVPVDGTPAVGSVAQWDANAGNEGSAGHVAYVEAVNDNSITVSEDVYSSGPFRWRSITVGDMKWPSHFIHFRDQSTGSAQNRVSILNPSSYIYAKDGLDNGGWRDQGTQAIAVTAGGQRQALINAANQVYAKDDLGPGGWLDQGATAKKVVVGLTGRMFIITPDNWVYGKDNLGAGGWLNQDAQAIDVSVGQTRVAIINACGAVYAKDNLGAGGWIQQTDCNTATDVEVGPTGRVAFIRTDGEVFAKDDISSAGGWYDQAATAVQVGVGGARLMILTPNSYVYAKDNLGAGGWINQGAQAVQIGITKQGRLVLRNAANYVYSKDDINPGGWYDQGAQALKLGV